MNISKNVKISGAIAPAAGVAAQTDIEGTILDMQGFEGVLMVIRFGTITTSAVTVIKARQGAANNLSDAADLLGSGQDIADDDDEKIFYIDLFKPTERYVQLYVVRGTQDAIVAEARYIQYRARKKPTTQGTNVSGETLVSPAEGTA